MTFNVSLVASMLMFFWVIIGVLDDWGEMRTPKPYVVDWIVLFVMTGFCAVFWLLGYLSRKDGEE